MSLMNALYAIKFIGFVGIFLTHITYPFDFGAGFTTFFFIFSGFIQMYSFNKKKFKLTEESYKNFLVDKFIKNYPIYLVTLLLSIPYIYPTEHFVFNIKDFLIHLFMLQPFAFNYGTKIYMFNGLSWFMAVLMWFYIIIPLIYHFVCKIKNHRNCKFIMATLFFIAINFAMAYYFRGTIEMFSKRWWLLYISPISRFSDILVGFFLGGLYINYEDKLKKAVKKIPKLVFTIFEVLALSSIALINVKLNISKSFYICGLGFYPTAFALIFIFSFDRGYISDLFSKKFFIKLGKNCIAYYMLHQTVINYFALFLGAQLWYWKKRLLPFQLTGTLIVLLFIIFFGNCLLDNIFNPLYLALKKRLIDNKKQR